MLLGNECRKVFKMGGWQKVGARCIFLKFQRFLWELLLVEIKLKVTAGLEFCLRKVISWDYGHCSFSHRLQSLNTQTGVLSDKQM